MPGISTFYKLAHFLKWSFFTVFIFTICLFVLLRSSWGQNLVKNKVINFVSQKIETKLEVKKLYIGFLGDVVLEGFYLEDQQKDTLVYSKKLSISVAVLPILTNNTIRIKKVKSTGFYANIHKLDPSQKYNFNYIIDAFSEPDSITKVSSEESKSPYNIKIETINLQDVKLLLKDKFTGIDSRLVLGKLNLSFTQKFNLDIFQFPIDKLFIENTQVRYVQTTPLIKPEQNTDTAPLPIAQIDLLKLNEIHIDYQDRTTNTFLNVKLNNFTLDNATLDFKNKNVALNKLGLKNSFVSFNSDPPPSSVDSNQEETFGTSDFKWPDWQVHISKVLLKNNTISFKKGQGNVKKLTNTFNWKNTKLSKFNFSLKDVEFSKDYLSLNLQNFSFIDKSGFQLKEFEMKLKTDTKKTTISSFRLKTNQSSLAASASLEYNSIQDLIQNPAKTSFNITTHEASLRVQDAFYFQSELRNQMYVNKLSKNKIKIKLKANGTLSSMDVSLFEMNWGAKTKLNFSANIKDIITEDKLSFRIPDFRFKTDKKTLTNFVDKEKLGIQIPDVVELTSNTSGSLKNVITTTKLHLSEGNILLKGSFENNKKLKVNGIVKVEALQLGTLLKNSKIGTVDFTTTANADWTNIENLNADFKTQFNNLSYNSYNYNPLSINAKISNGSGKILANFKDENLDVTTTTYLQLDSIASSVKTIVQLDGINFNGLQLTQENLKAKGVLEAGFTQSKKGYRMSGKTKETLVLYNQKTIPIADFLAKATLAQDSTHINIESDFLLLRFNANSDFKSVKTSLKKHINSYFLSPQISKNHISKKVVADVDLVLKNAPIFSDFLLKDFNNFEPITLRMSFDEAQEKLNINTQIPQLKHQKSSIKNAALVLESNQQDFKLQMDVNNIDYAPIYIESLNLSGKIINETMYVNFSALDHEKKIVNIQTEIVKDKNVTRVYVNPNKLILNRNLWSIPENNAIEFTELGVTSSNFELSRNQQKLVFEADINKENNQKLHFDFKQFNLANMLSFLNPEKEISSGIVEGYLDLLNNKQTTLVSDINIHQLKVLGTTLGTLSLAAKNTDNHGLSFNASLKESNQIDLEIDGSYTANNSNSPIDVKVNLKKLALKKVEPFTESYISDTSGSLLGRFNLSGGIEKPIYNGSLYFSKVQLKIISFNTLFTFPEESIKFSNAGIKLDNFRAFDNNKNDFVLDGEILTEILTNPQFNFTIKTKKLQILNSTKKDNELYFGKLFLGANLNVLGDLKIPKVKGTLQIMKDSDFTYIVPRAKQEIIEREGVVVFVNKGITNDVLTSKKESYPERVDILTGYDIKTILKVDKSAVLNVVIDPKTGDNLQVSGEADLNFNLSPNGNTMLTGKYEVASGHYEANLYNLVTRKFEIDKGSSILWQGDPLEAKMDIRAIYKVKTQASGLMSSVTSGLSVEALNQYRRKLPFWVYLNLKGELLKPEINFKLDIPEDARGELGGQVYNQVQQLNNREESLNKQVFSLLVLNQFFPSNTSDGSSGGAISIARDNVNKVLSNQLNNYSNKLLGNSGVELGFELDSYTDYSAKGQQNNTELNVSAEKKLFNDRLTVQVGSGFELENNSKKQSQKTPLIGNVNIEYALTENRRFRLKGFRKNEFQSVIDGQVVVTGIAFLFNREFTKFKELWYKEKQQTQVKNETSK